MAKLLVGLIGIALLAAAALVSVPLPAQSAEADVYWQCVSTAPASWCPAVAANPLPVAPAAAASGGASYAHIAAGQATTVVKSGPGTLYSITFNSKATSTNVTTVYDNTAASGTIIAIPDAVNTAAVGTMSFGPSGIAFTTGLTIATTTANGSDMTVIFK